jgi:Phytanoyl-CoA dioxygenase (PhyH)
MLTEIFNDPINEELFRQKGYVVLDLLQQKDLDELHQAFSQVEAQHQYDFVASVVLHDLEMRRSIHQNLAPILERCLLPILKEYRLFLSNFVAKKAASQNGKFPLHQDPTFAEEGDRVGITIWCPMVDVGLENGCLGVVPGSHLLNNKYRSPSMLPYPDLVEIIESNYLQYIPMKAGQVLLMDTRVIHGSPPNLSNRMRPVAAGVMIPSELSLICCYVDENADPVQTHVYEVPDDFYLRHRMLSLPAEGKEYKTMERKIEPLSKEKISTLFQALSVNN